MLTRPSPSTPSELRSHKHATVSRAGQGNPIADGKGFGGRAMFAWAHERGLKLFLIEPGKPNPSAYIESMNVHLRTFSATRGTATGGKSNSR